MSIAELYHAITFSISEETGASDSLLHVHAGMAVLLAARIISGRSLATPLPFLVVCIFAIGNEVLDRINNGSWLWLDSGLDLLNTIFWPFVLMIGLRMRRSRAASRRVEQPH